MKSSFILLPSVFAACISLSLISCKQSTSSNNAPEEQTVAEIAKGYTNKIVRISSTFQRWSSGQPWDKNKPYQRGALGVVVEKNQVLTTAEMAADATYIEIEHPESGETFTAQVAAIDYDANLALLQPTDEEGTEALSQMTAVNVAKPEAVKSTAEIVQLEDNGLALVTEGKVQGTDMLSTFAPGGYFLAYKVKASLQSATSSFTLPVFANNKLLGILTTYDSEDQISNIIACEVIEKFLHDAADGTYTGFPKIGLGAQPLEDPTLRDYLKISETTKGMYVSTVKSGAAAEQAGIREGDVLLKVAGHEIDKKGYYEDSAYGRTYWTHLVRGRGTVGENIDFSLLREGKEINLQVIPKSARNEKSLIPSHMHDQAPPFLVKGGLVFQELSLRFLKSFDEDWRNKAPLNLLTALDEQDELMTEGRNRIVILTGVIPTPATIGYERMRNTIVEQVNGQAINDIESLLAAFAGNSDPIHSIKIDRKPSHIFLDELLSTQIDTSLLERGLPFLSRTASDAASELLETSEEEASAVISK